MRRRRAGFASLSLERSCFEKGEKTKKKPDPILKTWIGKVRILNVTEGKKVPSMCKVVIQKRRKIVPEKSLFSHLIATI